MYIFANEWSAGEIQVNTQVLNTCATMAYEFESRADHKII